MVAWSQEAARRDSASEASSDDSDPSSDEDSDDECDPSAFLGVLLFCHLCAGLPAPCV